MRSMKTIFIFLFTSMSVFASECKISNIKVLGNNKVKDFKNGKLVQFYPILKDFKTYFPSKLNIQALTQGNCSSHTATLTIFHSKGQKKFHYHENKNKEKEIEGAHTVNAKYLSKSSYSSEKQKENNHQFSFTNVPHVRFYNELTEKFWINKVKYVVTLSDNSDKVTQVKAVELDSPLIH